eukprot:scaffold10715_cov114-Isochrysis_galbana.AAC.16
MPRFLHAMTGDVEVVEHSHAACVRERRQGMDCITCTRVYLFVLFSQHISLVVVVSGFGMASYLCVPSRLWQHDAVAHGAYRYSAAPKGLRLYLVHLYLCMV